MPIRKISRNDKLIFALIMFLALALRLYFFVGASMEDDLGIEERAFWLSNGHWEYGIDLSLRRMNYAPIALAYRIAGVHVFTTHVYHMLCALMMIATAFFLARLFFGLRAAVCSSVFLAFVPLHIVYSSRLMPSIPESMWGGLAIWLLCAIEARGRPRTNLRSLLSYAGVGILIGVAYLCRETGIVMWSVPLAYLTVEMIMHPENIQRRFAQGLAVSGGCFSILGGESLWYFCATRDWLHRWHVVHAAQANTQGIYPWHFFLDQLLNIYNTQLFSGSLRDGLREILSPQNHYWSPMLGLMGFAIFVSVAVYALKAARGPQKIILFWFLAYFLFLSFSVISLSPYLPARKFPRYQLLYLTPASIMVGWFLDFLWRKKKGAYVVFPCAAILLASSLYYTRQAYQYARSYYHGAVELRRLISQHVDPDIPLYLDGFEICLFDLWDGHHSIYRYLNDQEFPANQHPAEGAYVVVLREMNRDVIVAGPNAPSFALHRPADWVKVGELNLGSWEFFKPGVSPVLYYIPPLRKNGPAR